MSSSDNCMTPYWYLLTCYYCRARKPDVIRDEEGNEIARLMYSNYVKKKMEDLFLPRFPNVVFDSKYTELWINRHQGRLTRPPPDR